MRKLCYFYLGSRSSAHFSYLMHNVSHTLNVKRFHRSFLGILALIFSITLSSLRRDTIISSSPVVIFLSRLFLGVSIFDCHGNSRFLFLLKFVKPSFSVSNSRGTQILLRQMHINSNAWLPCPSDEFFEPSVSKAFEFLPTISSPLKVLVAGHLDGDFLDRFKSFVDHNGLNVEFKLFHFGRAAISMDGPNYEFFGYKDECEIASICRSHGINFGLVFYSERHKQRLFMSPLKCDFYDRLGLNILVPSYLKVIKYNKYNASLFTYDNDGVIAVSDHLRLIGRAPNILVRLGLSR